MLKSLTKFYINSSIHVAMAACCLCAVTFLSERFSFELEFFGFVFFASVTGYNFVKYAGIARLHHRSLTDSLKVIQLFSLVCFIALGYFIFQMPRNILLAVSFLGILTLLYALPILPKEKSLRMVHGIKVYVIALVWALVAGWLPYLYFDDPFNAAIVVRIGSYFLFILAIILPFEIRDMRYDAMGLHTIPQQIGIKKTKILGFALLAGMLLLFFFKRNSSAELLLVEVFVVLLAAIAVMFSKQEQSEFYSSFWVEGLPILWAVLLGGVHYLF